MLGSANVFGNPINFFHTLNSGIWDFVSAPAQSVHQVHITFLEPIASWWLWPSCMANLVGIAPGVWSCCIVSTQQFHISSQILIVEPQCLEDMKMEFPQYGCVATLFFLYRIWRFVLVQVHSNVGTKTLLSRVFLRLPYGYYLLKQIKLVLFLGEMDDGKEIHIISLLFWWLFSFKRWVIDCIATHHTSLATPTLCHECIKFDWLTPIQFGLLSSNLKLNFWQHMRFW